jgi:LiaI-LiaF-like transmembrane region/B-box zinc finger
MNCAVHMDAEAAGYCRNCGKALCSQCSREAGGALYCEPCISALVARPTAPAAPSGTNPWLAFLLGWVPGLGAVYNGEYIKALVHVGIFAGLITVNAHGADQPLWGLLLAAFICYMPIEAFVVARDRSRNPSAAPSEERRLTHAPVGPIVLIGLGALFLLNNLHVLAFDWIFENGWPVILIGIGGWMLWKRTRRNS